MIKNLKILLVKAFRNSLLQTFSVLRVLFEHITNEYKIGMRVETDRC